MSVPRCSPFTNPNRDSVASSRLEELLAASPNGAHGEELEATQLRRQPGFCGASIPELDRLVDVTSMVPGVLGAGLMGTGGGGCVLILARDGEEARQRVTVALAQQYYEPLGKAVEVERWEAVEGAGESSPRERGAARGVPPVTPHAVHVAVQYSSSPRRVG